MSVVCRANDLYETALGAACIVQRMGREKRIVHVRRPYRRWLMPRLDRTGRRGVYRNTRLFYVRLPGRNGKLRRFATYNEACAFKYWLDEQPAEAHARRPQSEPAPPRDLRGWVYFVAPVNGGPIKIGWSATDPSERIKELQVGSPVELELIGCRVGCPEDERGLHRRFRHDRLHGEWFRPSARLLTETESHAPACADASDWEGCWPQTWRDDDYVP